MLTEDFRKKYKSSLEVTLPEIYKKRGLDPDDIEKDIDCKDLIIEGSNWKYKGETIANEWVNRSLASAIRNRKEDRQ